MHVCMDMRLGPSTSVRIIAKSAFQGVRNKGFHCNIIDIRDYVNGIGNRSREPYIRARAHSVPCYSLHPVVRRC